MDASATFRPGNAGHVGPTPPHLSAALNGRCVPHFRLVLQFERNQTERAVIECH